MNLSFSEMLIVLAVLMFLGFSKSAIDFAKESRKRKQKAIKQEQELKKLRQ